MQTKVVTAPPLFDVRALEREHNAEYMFGDSTGSTRKVTLRPVASLAWCISIWHSRAHLSRIDACGHKIPVSVADSPEWRALVQQVVVVDHGSPSLPSGQYYPLSARSIELYALLPEVVAL